jgi:hypothetical protein
MARRFVIPAFVLAFSNLATLGLLIGLVGASRAYAVGLHTLFRDHLPAIVVAGLVAFVIAGVVGRNLESIGACARFLGFVIVADVVAGFVPIVIFDEITRYPDLPRILITETAGGTQILAVALGLLAGYGARRTFRSAGAG